MTAEVFLPVKYDFTYWFSVFYSKIYMFRLKTKSHYKTMKSKFSQSAPWKKIRVQRYGSTHSWHRHCLEINDQLHAPAAFLPGTVITTFLSKYPEKNFLGRNTWLLICCTNYFMFTLNKIVFDSLLIENRKSVSQSVSQSVALSPPPRKLQGLQYSKLGPCVSRHYNFCDPQTHLIVTTECVWAQNWGFFNFKNWNLF